MSCSVFSGHSSYTCLVVEGFSVESQAKDDHWYFIHEPESSVSNADKPNWLLFIILKQI